MSDKKKKKESLSLWDFEHFQFHPCERVFFIYLAFFFRLFISRKFQRFILRIRSQIQFLFLSLIFFVPSRSYVYNFRRVFRGPAATNQQQTCQQNCTLILLFSKKILPKKLILFSFNYCEN